MARNICGLVPVAINLECEARTGTASDMDLHPKNDSLGRIALNKNEERGLRDRVGTTFKLLVC